MAEHPAAKTIIRLLPGIVAASVGLIYVTGSVNAAGSLAREGLPVTTVRLFSLEQLLVRGVSVLTQPELLLLAVGFACLVALSFRTGPGGPLGWVASHAEARGYDWVGKLALFSVAMSSLAMLMLFSWRVAVVTLLTISFWLLLSGLLQINENGEQQERRGVTIACIVTFGFLTANYFSNIPQPEVRIVKYSGANLKGILVTHVNETWYLSPSASNRDAIESVPESSVRSAILFYDESDQSPSLGTLALGLF
jgi:hypothetical protein